MKKLLLLWIFSGSLDGFSQAVPSNDIRYLVQAPDGTYSIHKQGAKLDTTCEYMHLSIRDVGFVISRKALSVRVNGICVKHLQSNGRPFPVHYRVGWCEGRDELLSALLKSEGIYLKK